jgi:hypothetical protein
MAGESALASPPQTEGILHKALNFAQSDKNNESDISLYLQLIYNSRQTNLQPLLLQQRWRWVEGTSYGGRKARGRRNGTRGAEA